jgi:hypothetical protein
LSQNEIGLFIIKLNGIDSEFSYCYILEKFHCTSNIS